MKYRKKPVEIEAFQITKRTRRDNRDWPEWLNKAWNLDPRKDVGAVSPQNWPDSNGMDKIVINTLEGQMTVDWDDWIIQGVEGELYPCKPGIFAKTYEKVA